MSQSKPQCKSCPVFSSSCFANVDDETLLQIDQSVKAVRLKSGEVFDFKLDGANGCACVLKGHFKIQHELRGQERAVRVAGPGDLIGVRNMFADNSYFATAMEESQVCFLENTDFENLRKKSKEISENLIQLLCETLRDADQRIASLEAHPLRVRVAATILDLYRKMGRNQHLSADRATIAEMAGTVPESLARVLTEFEGEKVIERRGRSLYICDMAALETVATDY